MLRPKEVQDQLHVSAPTLRRWSDTFKDFLSSSAAGSTTETGGAAQRRYSDQDVLTFRTVQRLLTNGKTYEEVTRALQDSVKFDFEQEIESLTIKGPHGSSPAIVEAMEHPAVQIFREALVAKDQTIDALTATVAAKDETIKTLSRELSGKDELIAQVQAERDRLLQSSNGAAAESLAQTKTLVTLVEKLGQQPQARPESAAESPATTEKKSWWGRVFSS